MGFSALALKFLNLRHFAHHVSAAAFGRKPQQFCNFGFGMAAFACGLGVYRDAPVPEAG